MRVAIIALTNGYDLRGDSEFLSYVTLIRELNKIGKYWFYVVVPKGHTGYDIVDEFDNVTLLIEDRYRSEFFDESSLVDACVYKWFNQRTGLYQIDVALNGRIGASPHLYLLLRDYRYATEEMKVRGIPIINIEGRVYGRRNTHNVVDGYELYLRSVSYAMFPTVYGSKFEFDDAIDVAQVYLNDAMLKRMKENAVIADYGIMCERIDKLIEGVEKRDKFTLFYGGRLASQKRVKFILEVYAKVYEMGYDVDILITTPSIDVPKMMYKLEPIMKRCKRIKLLTGISSDEFIRYCASSHAWLSASLYEGFTVGHTEMGYTGVPGIVPNRPWSRYIFGDDYELMYNPNSMKEAVAMVCWVIENYDKAVRIAEKTRKRIKELFDARYRYMKIAQLMHSLHAEAVNENRLLSEGKNTWQTIEVVAKKFEGSEFTLFDFVAELKRWFRSKPDFKNPVMKMPSLWDIYQALKKLGFEDKYDKEYPVFVGR